MDHKAVLLIDGRNITHALEKVSPGKQLRVNYGALGRTIVSNIMRTGDSLEWLYRGYYTGRPSTEAPDKRTGFYKHLEHHHWTVVELPSKLCDDGIWRDKEVDISLAIDAFKYVFCRGANIVIVGSHDGDFAALFRRLPDTVRKYSLGFYEMMAVELKATSQVISLKDMWGTALVESSLKN